MDRQHLVPMALVLIALLSGCTASGRKPRITMENARLYHRYVEEPTAILKVTSQQSGSRSAMTSVWGAVHTPTPRESFAEMVAHFARTTGGMKILPPAEVSQRLRLAGLDPTLEPDSEQLGTYARTLGCETYLTAVVKKWRYTYFLTRAQAVAHFTLALRQPGVEEPVWQVDVEHKAGGKSEREVAAGALRATFERLRNGR